MGRRDLELIRFVIFRNEIFLRNDYCENKNFVLREGLLFLKSKIILEILIVISFLIINFLII